MASDSRKSVKTKQVMSLISSSSPSDVSPFLTGLPEEEKNSDQPKNKQQETTVEEKLKQYTDSKRGTVSSTKSTKKKSNDIPKNPMLHIPEDEPEDMNHKPSNAETAVHRQMSNPVVKEDKSVTIDVNEIILEENLEKALKRFNTCGCETCRAKISELVLRAVPIKIVTVPESKINETLDKYRDYTTKEISNTIVKIIMQNKRKPFH